jgi:hypothetical protein
MPSYVPRSLRPYSQQESLEKRERKLRRAIDTMASVEKLQKAAEDVRTAQLLLAKAELELIRYSENADGKYRERSFTVVKTATGMTMARRFKLAHECVAS